MERGKEGEGRVSKEEKREQRKTRRKSREKRGKEEKLEQIKNRERIEGSAEKEKGRRVERNFKKKIS